MAHQSPFERCLISSQGKERVINLPIVIPEYHIASSNITPSKMLSSIPCKKENHPKTQDIYKPKKKGKTKNPM
jgi:hypothetical protein